MRTTRLKVTLRSVEPRVLRVLDVPADSTLGELHHLLQIGVGWLDLEPHQFASGAEWYLPGVAEGTLADLGPRFRYLYAPKSRWEHDVAVLGSGGERAGCVYGEGACPPEGCAGPRDFQEQLNKLDEDLLALFWAPHGPEFDQAVTDLRVRQMAGMVPESVRLLLEITREGREAQALHELRPRWARMGSTTPLHALTGILRTTGLLGAERHSELFVVRKLRSWFPAGSFMAKVAGIGVGALAARGALSEDALIEAVRGEVHREHPVGPEDVRQALLHLLPALTGLDLAERTAGGWLPGPSARTLLPQATALSVYAPDAVAGPGKAELRISAPNRAGGTTADT